MSCDGPWAGPLMVFALLVAPFALPLAVLSFMAARKRWAQWFSVAVSLVGLVAFSVAVWTHPADPRGLPLLFVPPLLAWAIVLRGGGAAARRWAIVSAFVPLVGGIVFIVWLTETYVPCFT